MHLLSATFLYILKLFTTYYYVYHYTVCMYRIMKNLHNSGGLSLFFLAWAQANFFSSHSHFQVQAFKPKISPRCFSSFQNIELSWARAFKKYIHTSRAKFWVKLRLEPSLLHKYVCMPFLWLKIRLWFSELEKDLARRYYFLFKVGFYLLCIHSNFYLV